jgi:hypothetical protein
MTTRKQLSREQILALPPTCTITELAHALGVSEPVIRAQIRSGKLEEDTHIRVTKVGQQHKVVTETLWKFLGLPVPDQGAVAS